MISRKRPAAGFGNLRDLLLNRKYLQVSRLSADSSIAFVMKHEDLVENAKAAYVQVACLYTNFSGVKCIRVHTLALSSTNALSSTFRYTCVDTLTNVLVKETLQKELQQPNSPGPKTQLVEELVHILYAYRVNCASTSSYGQLILPESLKLLPLYVSSMFKQASFRRQNLNCRVDTRVAEMCQLMNACVTRTNAMLYPRVYFFSSSRSLSFNSTIHCLTMRRTKWCVVVAIFPRTLNFDSPLQSQCL